MRYVNAEGELIRCYERPSTVERKYWQEQIERTITYLIEHDQNIHQLRNLRATATITYINSTENTEESGGFRSSNDSYTVNIDDDDDYMENFIDRLIADWDEREGKLMKYGYALYLNSVSEITNIFVPASYLDDKKRILSEN